MANRPNILVITSDQYRYPRFSYGPEAGFDEGLKRILGFHEDLGPKNSFLKFFPGLLRLRQNAAVLNNHTIACTPSRATIYTGQYGTKTGVTQTDGLFKNGDDPDFPWLAADGIPTLGSWLREAGYATHYFGKWHVSNPPNHSLDAYGFDNWEESYPEPHGAQFNNLGVYRDTGFTDAVANFLGRMGLALDYNRAVAEAAAVDPNAPPPSVDDVKPWFAVASFVNPHDIATYPAVIAQAFPAQPETPPLPNGNPAKRACCRRPGHKPSRSIRMASRATAPRPRRPRMNRWPASRPASTIMPIRWGWRWPPRRASTSPRASRATAIPPWPWIWPSRRRSRSSWRRIRLRNASISSSSMPSCTPPSIRISTACCRRSRNRARPTTPSSSS
jgi:arylsulfatase A-like enzyme